MLLLGNYQSNLTAFLYQQLLAQLESSISQGEFGAGQLFDTSAAQTIQKEGQNFTTITVPASGNTAYAEDLNTPLDTLQARYTAITSEVANVQATIPQLLAVIAKEASLIDKTIAAAEVEVWGNDQPQLPTAQRALWNFESGHGVTSNVYPTTTYQTDPSNGVAYPAAVPDVSLVINEYFSPASDNPNIPVQGIGAPVVARSIPVKTIEWDFTANSSQSQFETIYGQDNTWAYLSFLEPAPILTFGAPNISVVLPIGGSAVGLFTASGSVAGGSLPVYVRILFYPRQQQIQVASVNAGQIIQLSKFNVTANTVQCFTATTVYIEGQDFTVDETGALTILSSGKLVGQSFTVLFQEYFPAYQCSIDQTNWSPIFMLDPNRPYPDDTTTFLPINIQGGNFPLSDELGVPLGLFLQVVGTPTAEMVLEITTPGSQTFGENANLTIALERAVYMDALTLEPFSNFPMLVHSIVAFGFTDDVQSTVLDIPVLLDRSLTFRFPRQLARKFVITLYQQNYALKEYIVEGPDALRRDTLANLQATLPFSVQRPAPAIPQHFEGALYEFGIQNVQAIDSQPVLPGVFSSGPYLVTGNPEVLRLDVDLSNMPQTTNHEVVYLAFFAYNGNDQVIDSGENPLTPGTTIAYSTLSTMVADHVNFFVKFVFRQELSVAQKLLLQVTTT